VPVARLALAFGQASRIALALHPSHVSPSKTLLANSPLKLLYLVEKLPISYDMLSARECYDPPSLTIMGVLLATIIILGSS
jgi:hypothetical protein